MSRHMQHKGDKSNQTTDAGEPRSHLVPSNQSRPRLSQEQVQKLWDRRTSSRKKLVRVPIKIAELAKETEFEGLSDIDYEAERPAIQSDRGEEKRSQNQKLITERLSSAYSFRMSLANLPNPAKSLDLPDPQDVHSIAMATRRARGSGSVASTGSAKPSVQSTLQESPEISRQARASQLLVDSIQPAEQTASPPSLEEQRHALDECWDFLESLYDLSSESRDQLIASASNFEAVRQTWDACWNLCVCMRALEQANHSTLLPEHVEPSLRFSRLLIQSLQSLELRTEPNLIRTLLRASTTHNSSLLDAITISCSDHNDQLHSSDMLATHVRYIHALLKGITIQPHQLLDHIKGCWLLFGSLYGLLLTRKARDARHTVNGNTTEQQQVVIYDKPEPEPNHEQLVATAIDAGMNLCNLFRHGWSLTRSGRTSPSKTNGSKNGSTASLHLSQYKISSSNTIKHRPSYLSENEDDGDSRLSPTAARAPQTPEMQRFHGSGMPDTPMTVFEDIEDPIEEFQEERRQGNMVLGTRGSVGSAGAWPPSVSEVGERRGRERRRARRKRGETS